MRPTEHWRSMVVARRRQMDAAYAALGRTSADYWTRRAPRFAAARPIAATDDLTVETCVRLARADGIVIDVGAGSGRLALAIAARVRQVVAVEPSAAMAARLREHAGEAGITNVVVVEQEWQRAEVARADVALCANVLYPIEEPAPFIRRLESHARRAVVLAMAVTWTEPPLLRTLWKQFHGDERVGQPEAYDTIGVLHEMGIPANVLITPAPAANLMWTFDSISEAVPVVREHLILPERPEIDAALAGALRRGMAAEDGGFVIPGPERASATIWWEHDGPRRPPLHDLDSDA